MNLKEKLIDLLESTGREEQTYITSLTEAQRSATGTPEQWSSKDILVHIGFWENQLANRLSAALKNEEEHPAGDYQKVNEEIFEQHRFDTWEQVIDYSTQANNALIEVTQALSDDQLTSIDLLESQQNQPIWKRIVGNGHTHPLLHLAQCFAQAGQAEYASQMMEEATCLEVALDDSPESIGNGRYNLACHYALIGETAKAIPLLAEAFEYLPSLVEWSKQDTDLDCLRDLPEFQALYK
jgi:tetratricopeptide (TPR) repeat protein